MTNSSSPRDSSKLDVCHLFGLHFPVASLSETANLIADAIAQGRRFQVVTPNMEYIYWKLHESELCEALHSAEILTPDGMPLVLLSRIPGRARKPLPERVTGADLLPALCSHAARHGWRVMLMGGASGVAQEAADKLSLRYPGLESPRALAPEMYFEQDPGKERKVIKAINAYKPHILAVAMGCPRQERWIRQAMPYLDANALVGVGATLDFLAGRQQRAPLWMQKSGLEWCWRLIKSPRRLSKRYLWHYPQLLPLVCRELAQGDRVDAAPNKPWWQCQGVDDKRTSPRNDL